MHELLIIILDHLLDIGLFEEILDFLGFLLVERHLLLILLEVLQHLGSHFVHQSFLFVFQVLFCFGQSFPLTFSVPEIFPEF